MTIGTALFSALASRSMSRTGAEIAALQERISAGTNDPRPSADPVRAARLSAATEARAALGRYATGVEAASTRLGLVDAALGDAGAVLRRFNELALQGATDSLPPSARQSLIAEARSLRAALIESANRTDLSGRGLFAGSARGPAFADQGGRVVQQGNGAVPYVRVSDTATLPTTLSGSTVFMGVPGPDGARSVFDIVDDAIAAMAGPGLPQAAAEGQAILTPAGAGAHSFTLTGPGGAVRIAAAVTPGAPGPMIDAINAATGTTGITAAPAPDGAGIVLSAAGTIAVSGADRGDAPRAAVLTLAPALADGTPAGPAAQVHPARMTAAAMVDMTRRAVDHIADQRATAGAHAAFADQRAAAIATRKLTIDQTVAGLGDLDIAAAVTRLQTLLTGQEAAQQTFVRITQQSLFDWMR